MVDDTRVGSSDEIDSLRAAKSQIDLKYKLLKERYIEDVSSFNEVRVDQIFKNSGARDYLERLKDRVKTKDEIIDNLRVDLEFRNKEIAELEDRCKKMEAAKEEYLRHWKDAQTARERLEADLKSNLSSVRVQHQQQRRLTSRSHNNMSSSSSLVDAKVPPPPLVDVPTIDEILSSAPSPEDGNNPYTSLDSTIPPPPPMDIPLDELLQGSGSQAGNTKAFEQEQGQYLCHVYACVDSESNTEVLGDIIELVEAESRSQEQGAFRGWRAINTGTDVESDSSGYHVTLLRGHRVIYHHQINHLVDSIESTMTNHQAVDVCLDRLRIFNNYEGTRQFLSLATRETGQAKEAAHLRELKLKIRDVMDQFATRMTVEDEFENTLAHCSLMCRDMQQVPEAESFISQQQEIEALCTDNLSDYPICLFRVETIHVKIGNRVYRFNLSKRPS